MFYRVSFIILLLIIPAILFAQTSQTGQISGRVTDKQTGESLPGANVFLQGTNLGAATDIKGRFVIINVPPGSYTVQAAFIGYKTATLPNVRVNNNLGARLEFQLDAETLEVSEIQIDAAAPSAIVRLFDSIALLALALTFLGIFSNRGILPLLTTSGARILFALAFGVFGISNILNYSGLVSLPYLIPRGFWLADIVLGQILGFLSGLLFLAACISLILQKKARLYSLLLAAGLGSYVAINGISAILDANLIASLNRLLIDLALTGGALTYAGIAISPSTVYKDLGEKPATGKKSDQRGSLAVAVPDLLLNFFRSLITARKDRKAIEAGAIKRINRVIFVPVAALLLSGVIFKFLLPESKDAFENNIFAMGVIVLGVGITFTIIGSFTKRKNLLTFGLLYIVLTVGTAGFFLEQLLNIKNMTTWFYTTLALATIPFSTYIISIYRDPTHRQGLNAEELAALRKPIKFLTALLSGSLMLYWGLLFATETDMSVDISGFSGIGLFILGIPLGVCGYVSRHKWTMRLTLVNSIFSALVFASLYWIMNDKTVIPTVLTLSAVYIAGFLYLTRVARRQEGEGVETKAKAKAEQVAGKKSDQRGSLVVAIPNILLNFFRSLVTAGKNRKAIEAGDIKRINRIMFVPIAALFLSGLQSQFSLVNFIDHDLFNMWPTAAIVFGFGIAFTLLGSIAKRKSFLIFGLLYLLPIMGAGIEELMASKWLSPFFEQLVGDKTTWSYTTLALAIIPFSIYIISLNRDPTRRQGLNGEEIITLMNSIKVLRTLLSWALVLYWILFVAYGPQAEGAVSLFSGVGLFALGIPLGACGYILRHKWALKLALLNTISSILVSASGFWIQSDESAFEGVFILSSLYITSFLFFTRTARHQERRESETKVKATEEIFDAAQTKTFHLVRPLIVLAMLMDTFMMAATMSSPGSLLLGFGLALGVLGYVSGDRLLQLLGIVHIVTSLVGSGLGDFYLPAFTIATVLSVIAWRNHLPKTWRRSRQFTIWKISGFMIPIFWTLLALSQFTMIPLRSHAPAFGLALALLGLSSNHKWAMRLGIVHFAIAWLAPWSDMSINITLIYLAVTLPLIIIAIRTQNREKKAYETSDKEYRLPVVLERKTAHHIRLLSWATLILGALLSAYLVINLQLFGNWVLAGMGGLLLILGGLARRQRFSKPALRGAVAIALAGFLTVLFGMSTPNFSTILIQRVLMLACAFFVGYYFYTSRRLGEKQPTAQIKAGGVGVAERVKSILLSPRSALKVAKSETITVFDLMKGYVAIVAAIPAIAQFIGLALVGHSVFGRRSFIGTLLFALLFYALSLLSVFVFGKIIDFLAPRFRSTKDNLNSFKLSTYAFTPAWIAGIFHILPGLQVLALLGSLYGIYILYVGLPILMQTPRKKVFVYTVISLIGSVILMVLSGSIATVIALGSAVPAIYF